MSRGRQGMQRNVQAALGLTERTGPPEIHVGHCYCGDAQVIGTDREVPALACRGLAFGRMVIFCPRCRRPSQIFPGPKMLTREDLEGPEAPRFWASPKSTKKQLAADASRRSSNRRAS